MPPTTMPLPITRTMLAAVLLAVASIANAGESRKFGEMMPAGEAVRISVAIAAHQDYAGKAQRFSGRIAEVCQKEGCWLVLEDDGQSARVMMRDHEFAVPKDASGRAEVHGVLSRHQLTPEAVKHMQEESSSGLPVSDVEYRIVADGVEIAG
ncbi:uncharacterized protein DUF4920 [Luteimonas cucumeris]|uniref:Uncharacterized protein DUF4920 n=1 Tax=Luteimonas cucumeris TaxID=985012 RepID=A0A562L2L2_9GAMM|nr:DUF4920 domain-containing protein [Luteimonas cucumeris]TWI01875.1 uncharacterized protein DUF4920 [Luteimonas cucumeris]